MNRLRPKSNRGRWIPPRPACVRRRLRPGLRLPRGSRPQDGLRGHELHHPARRRSDSRMPPAIIDLLLQHLYRERLIEIRETLTPQNRRYAMLDRGWERVRRLSGFERLYRTGARFAQRLHRNGQDARKSSDHPSRPRRSGPPLPDLVLPDTDPSAARRGCQLKAEPVHHRRAREWQDLDCPGPPSGARRRDLDSPGHRGRRHIISVFDSHNHAPVDPSRLSPTTNAGSRSDAPSRGRRRRANHREHGSESTTRPSSSTRPRSSSSPMAAPC